jgi:hypothetical protein
MPPLLLLWLLLGPPAASCQDQQQQDCQQSRNMTAAAGALQAMLVAAAATVSGARLCAGGVCPPGALASTVALRTAVSGAAGLRTSRCCAMRVVCTSGRCRACPTTPARWQELWRWVLLLCVGGRYCGCARPRGVSGSVNSVISWRLYIEGESSQQQCQDACSSKSSILRGSCCILCMTQLADEALQQPGSCLYPLCMKQLADKALQQPGSCLYPLYETAG